VERACERCAGDDEELVLVRRAGAAGAGAGGGDSTELWCQGCRAEDAHEVVDDLP
jgi:hypothetical protein